MGFLDKAKKLAEQAQTKLDEVQKQVNQPGSAGSQGGPAVEYDKHGRPIPQQQPVAPPHGDPLAGAASAPPPAPPSVPPPAAGGWSAPAPPAAPDRPPARAARRTGLGPVRSACDAGRPADRAAFRPAGARRGLRAVRADSGRAVDAFRKPPATPGAPEAEVENRNRPSYTPPKLTGGDPLAG